MYKRQVKESLGKFSAIPTIDFGTEDMPDIPAFEQARPIEPPKVHYNTCLLYTSSGIEASRILCVGAGAS